MYIILFKLRDAPDSHAFGPYADYMQAEDAICKLPVARDCEYKYIQELREDVNDYSLSDDGVEDFDDENIYDFPGISQSIEEDKS